MADLSPVMQMLMENLRRLLNMALCFLDRTFCKSDCINKECPRFFSEELRLRAQRWAKEILKTPGGAPIAFADFSTTCPDYKKP